MPQLTERDAEKLSPEQATALVRVIDLQARWDGLLADKHEKTGMSDLHARQKANDAYQAALREYGARFRTAAVPEPTHAVPDRLAAWCRTLRVVFARAESGSAVAVMDKVYRLADRIAERMSQEKVARASAHDLTGAVQELDAVIAWYVPPAPPAPLLQPKKGEAA